MDNIYIRFGKKLYRQNVGIPMGTDCAPLVADLFLFCYERDFMTSLSDDEFTCTANEGCSIVDYCIIASKLFPFLCSFEIGHRTEVVHFSIEFSFYFPLKGITNNVRTGNSDRCISKYKWSEENKTRFLETFTAILSENKNDILHAIETDVYNAVQQIVNLYQNAGSFMKRKDKTNFKIKQPAWWDNECNRQKSKKFKLLKLFRRCSSEENLKLYKESRNVFKEMCKLKQLSWQKRCREDLINCRANNTLFWKKIKSYRNKPRQEFDITDSQWFDHFKSLLYDEGVRKLRPKIGVYYADDNVNDMFNSPFTEEELKTSISALKNGKASGPDGILAEMIKSTMHKILPILLLLYNKILSSGEFPHEWMRSIICPILKYGSLLDPGNFRGISQIDILNKY